MATSLVQVANMALTMLGQENTIEALTERSKSARVMNLWMEPARRFALQSHDWTFARKRLALALHDEDPPSVWAFRYQAPSDMIQPRYIEVPKMYRAAPFDVESSADGETSTIVTDIEDAVLSYTRDCTQVHLFSPAFVLVLARALAAYASIAITGNSAVERNQWALYERQLHIGTNLNAKQGIEATPQDSDMITGR